MLLIEEGRHIDRNNRKSTKCNMNVLENEYHFLMVCPYYRSIRMEYLPKYYNSWPSIQNFKNLMKSENRCTLDKLAKYIYLANCKLENVQLNDEL
jgi:hypothetical protein